MSEHTQICYLQIGDFNVRMAQRKRGQTEYVGTGLVSPEGGGRVDDTAAPPCGGFY